MFLRRSLVLLSLLYIAAAQSTAASRNVHDLLASMRRNLLRPGAEFSLYDPTFPLDSGDAVQRRTLKQEDESACLWSDNTCGISGETAGVYLKTADNSVAEHVYRMLECRRISDKDYCEALRCNWNNDRCALSFEEDQEFRSAKCLEKARHIIDKEAETAECYSKSSKDDCTAVDRCYWHGDQCNLDKWYFYFHVKTEDLLPEGAVEGIEARTLEIDSAIESAREAGVIGEWSDLLDWDPPPFDCPLSKQVLCNYVEALTPFITHERYCSSKYASLENTTKCKNDAYCISNPTNAERPCSPDSEALLPAFHQLEMEFAKAIKDPNARAFEMKETDCMYAVVRKDCEKNVACHWSDTTNNCHLSFQWIEKQKYRLIGKEKDRVCQYFVLSVEYGCVDFENEKDCAEEARCFYDVDSEVCSIAYKGQVEYALAVGDSLNDFLEKDEECAQATNKRTCLAVSLEDAGKKRDRRTPDDEKEMEEMEGDPSATAPAYVEEESATIDFLVDVDDFNADDVEQQEDQNQGLRSSLGLTPQTDTGTPDSGA